jgi:hypothetical protein
MYLDVGVDGIQSYLARTPDLKGRRGASAWLSHATDRDELRRWIASEPALSRAGVAVNDEAGEADGLVPLRMAVTTAPGDIAELVMTKLRRQLPGIRISANWGSGASYIQAHQAWHATRQQPMLVSLPPVGDFPPLESCVLCRVDPAVGEIELQDEKEKRICADCRQRYVDRYRRPGLESGAVPVGKERWLLDELGLDTHLAVQTFEGLAKLGGPDGNRNHLATVFIDGNAIGALFRRILDGNDPNAKQVASKAVTDATRQALLEATRDVLDNQTKAEPLPVVPHVLGGDDLLVSVVADRAWRFVTRYLSAFEQRLGDNHEIGDFLGGDERPTASAGVVFARATFPFRRAVELSETLLKRAKRAHAGQTPAVAWLDVTQDGEHAPPHRSAWTRADLETRAKALRELRVAVPPSARTVLERLIDLKDPALSLARLREQVRRLGREEVLTPWFDWDPTMRRLLDALSLVRWWR